MDPRACTRRQSSVSRNSAGQRAYYRLADEPRPAIAVACSKCAWRAEFSRVELIAMYGSDCPLPKLLDYLASPNCAKVGNQWDRGGGYYVNPIGGGLGMRGPVCHRTYTEAR